ncbi:cysteine desulfurase family protein (TIGR01976 family) [Streptomyces umbrinus]|uniref:Cysteine desulfurase family protein (TIGR01976 family) n=1 Tax=Streptomyces umbrinus TaxID=67370 RepID=A0ABU0SJ55_9ACTN|nr:cysteine desulfurase-like protein [Streptomyces umbrinus]MDQ1023472.1 cysteine desulfurase family protein (TIGR01976 family) [Streptomyces umbrinus]
MTYDITALRSQFPALSAGTAHFDGPGGTQTPQPVIRAIADALAQPLSNRGQGTPGERNAESIITKARQALADLLGADPRGIVFGRSATQLTYDFSRALAKTWSPGDEVVVTRLDHDANIRPWVQAAAQAGATVRWADFDPATGELTAADVRAVLSPRTRLVAVTAASNLIGTRPPIAEISGLVRDAGALTYVDGVHCTAHALVDLERLGADFFVCSPYKFLGPHHGVLAARPELLETLRPDKLLPSTDAVPERFELGTLPYEFLAGTAAAVDFLAALDTEATGTRRQRLTSAFMALEAHEQSLRAQLDKGLSSLTGVQVHSRAVDRTPTLLLTFEGRSSVEAYRFLAERGVHAPSGSFYAIEASRRLGLGDAGGLRIGLAPYNNTEDVERLLDGLSEFLAL